MPNSKSDFIRSFSKALRNNNAAIFAGAGLSQSAGFVNWRELLRGIAEDVGLDIKREHDLISVAQYHCNEKGGKGKLNQLLLDEFTAQATLTKNHQILARLPIDTYWTTNYDSLIERALENAGKKADIKITPASLATTLSGRDTVVFKMHGDARSPEDAVITKDDYESYNESRQLFTTELQGDLVSKTFAFIGFSFDDTNLEYILSRIRILLGKNQRPHFCFFRQINRADFDSDTEFSYAQVKQELRINDLQRFAIHSVLIDEYDEITKILSDLEKAYWQHAIFVSASASEYGDWTEERALTFAQELTRTLASEFEIISGFGQGIGSAVINGVLEHINATGAHRIDGHLTLRPFPQWVADPAELPQLWTRYRNEMLSLAGIAVFMFGNKSKNGEIVAASGMQEEFEIAVNRGLAVIPIGATGYKSQELWQLVYDNFSIYYPNIPQLKPLIASIGPGDVSNRDLIKNVLKIIHEIRKH